MEYHVFNIGLPATTAWWQQNLDREVITAGFDAETGDSGDQVLNDMAEGDRVLAYCNGGKWSVHVDIVYAPGQEVHSVATPSLDGTSAVVENSPEADHVPHRRLPGRRPSTTPDHA